MQWFKHDTASTMDSKIKKLLIRYGAIGYAVYFHCLELIAGSVSEANITFELEHDSEIIADDLRISGTSEKSGKEFVEEIMNYMIQLNLFEESNGHIFCFKLLKRLDASMTSNSNFRAMIKKAKENQLLNDNHDTVMTKSCSNHDTVMQEKNRKEKNRRDDDDRQTADSQNCEIGETSSSKYRFFTSEQLEKMGADIEDTATDLDSFGDLNTELKKSCKQKGITGFPTPKEVYVFYHANKLPISPERFWELNNLKKWTDNNGQQIRHWENAYIQLCEWSNPDEEYNPALEFNSSNYDTYSGVIEGVGKEFC